MPKDVVVDTGPLVALFDLDDIHHERAVQFIRDSRTSLVSSLAVVTEAMHILAEDLLACQNLLAMIQVGGLTILEPELADFQRISELMQKYADLPMDFADAVVVSLCERLSTNHIATVDRDFTIYRYKRQSKFINVFLP